MRLFLMLTGHCRSHMYMKITLNLGREIEKCNNKYGNAGVNLMCWLVYDLIFDAFWPACQWFENIVWHHASQFVIWRAFIVYLSFCVRWRTWISNFGKKWNYCSGMHLWLWIHFWNQFIQPSSQRLQLLIIVFVRILFAQLEIRYK